MWTEVSPALYERVDGARVWKGDDYHSNPLNPRSRMWEGAGPHVNQTLVKRARRDRRERFVTRRRFGSPEAAMQAVDLIHPIRAHLPTSQIDPNRCGPT
jgi:hypothetical protein